MINAIQLRDDVVKPVVLALTQLQTDQSGLAPDAAVELLLGTAMQESHLGDYLAQVHGPALGIWQMEPATEKDIWTNYLEFRGPLRAAVSKLTLLGMDRTAQLAGNLYYACAMARVKYMRAPDPLPRLGDYEAQAIYYVKNYNAGGRATVEEYIANYHLLQQALQG